VKTVAFGCYIVTLCVTWLRSGIGTLLAHHWERAHHHHQITKLSHSINAIGPAKEKKAGKQLVDGQDFFW
jgi:hypothetical protein